MITQPYDPADARETGTRVRPTRTEPSYSVSIPADALDERGDLIDALISFAFDNLDARRFQLRVYDQV